MQTAHELFVHELQDMLDAEQQLVEALGSQAEESSRPELQKAFQSHQAQTEKQVERLRQVFESIGEEPEEVECKGIRGLIEEHDHFKEEEDPADDIMDIFNTGAAEKVESYEICAYESLIRLAGPDGTHQGFEAAEPEPEGRAADAEEDAGLLEKAEAGKHGHGEDEDEESDTESMEDESSQRGQQFAQTGESRHVVPADVEWPDFKML